MNFGDPRKLAICSDLKRSFHNTRRESPVMTPKFFFYKGAWPGLRDPLNFWVLNANSSKTVEDTTIKFGTRTRRESLVMTSKNFFQKGGVARVT